MLAHTSRGLAHTGTTNRTPATVRSGACAVAEKAVKVHNQRDAPADVASNREKHMGFNRVPVASTWLIGLSAAISLAAPASAVVVIDQPIDHGSLQVLFFSPVGQSFTAVTDSLSSIGVVLVNSNPVTPANERFMTVRLFDQVGLVGNVLGQSTVDVLAILGNTPQAKNMIDFGFGSVALTVGQSYSFQLVVTTSRWGVAYSSGLGGNPYAGGRAYYASNPAFPVAADTDLTFRVSAVPEPGAAWLLLAGLVALGYRNAGKASRAAGDQRS